MRKGEIQFIAFQISDLLKVEKHVGNNETILLFTINERIQIEVSKQDDDNKISIHAIVTSLTEGLDKPIPIYMSYFKTKADDTLTNDIVSLIREFGYDPETDSECHYLVGWVDRVIKGAFTS